jgi:hypothetical protein
VTSYRADEKHPSSGDCINPRMVLDMVNFLAPLIDEGTPITSAPDLSAAPKP